MCILGPYCGICEALVEVGLGRYRSTRKELVDKNNFKLAPFGRIDIDSCSSLLKYFYQFFNSIHNQSCGARLPARMIPFGRGKRALQIYLFVLQRLKMEIPILSYVNYCWMLHTKKIPLQVLLISSLKSGKITICLQHLSDLDYYQQNQPRTPWIPPLSYLHTNTTLTISTKKTITLVQ